MSINDIYNVANLYRANAYIRVNTTSADKNMGQEQSLFGTTTSQNEQENSFLLFPNTNEYDNEESIKNKNDGFLFM